MCCFSQPVRRVGNTRIFARRSSGDGQYLAYQMEVETMRPTAMILPLPVALPATADAVRFISLEEYPGLFDDLDRLFPRRLIVPAGGGRRVTERSQSVPLPVEVVGDFVASFVPTLGDFARLDPRFVIKPAVWQRLPQYADYGFAVFQLNAEPKIHGQIHPMALEFTSRLRDRLFFPTVHIHDGQIHREEAFDHHLYWQGRSSNSWSAAMKRLPYSDTPARMRRAEPQKEYLEATGLKGRPAARTNLSVRPDIDEERSKGLYLRGAEVYRWTIRRVRPNEDIVV